MTANFFNRRNLSTVFWSVLLLLSFLFLLRVLAQPDPDGRLIWARAQRLEAANLIRPALRQYELLADTYPGSPYALRALRRESEILVDLAQGGETARFRDALDVLGRLASNYPQSEIASDALLQIGEIQRAHLKNLTLARATYTRLMSDYPGQRDVVSQAMIALGRVAQAARDGKTAQSWFQKTLRTFPEQPERCGEAQFRLGETYETLWRQKEWARNAYDATIQGFPDTVWAARARENLGLLVYGDMVPSARRVLVRTTGAFDGGAQTSSDTLLNALRVVLGARGVNADENVLRGWSLAPFIAAFDVQNPSRVAAPQPNAFENAVAMAGMTYSVSDGGDSNSARRNLQNEIDTGHLTLVYNGQWQLVAGYDSSQNLIFLQSGARVQPVSVAEFLKSWSIRSPLGGSFTLIAFSTQSDDLRAKENLSQLPVDRILAARRQPIVASANAKSANEKAGKTAGKNSAKNAASSFSIGDELPDVLATRAHPIPVGTQVAQLPRGLSAPTWVFTPPVLNEKTAYRRAIRRAVLWMRRPRSNDAPTKKSSVKVATNNGVLLNLEALRALSQETFRLANTPIAASNPNLSATPQNEPLARQNALDPNNDYIANDARNDANSLANDAAPSSTRSPETRQTPDVAKPDAANPAAAKPLSPPAPVAAPIVVDAPSRVRALLGWRGAPLMQWLEARRDAAAFLDLSGDKLQAPALKQAAQNLRQAAVHLQNVRVVFGELAVLDATGGLGENGASSTRCRALLLQAAREIELARIQEMRATDLMAQI